jgi:signal transduction histidine kinase/CheY-like chemotaxis protein
MANGSGPVPDPAAVGALPMVGAAALAGGATLAELLQCGLEDAPAVVAIHQGPEHHFVFVNRLFREHTDGRELVGRAYADAFPEFVAQGYLDIFNAVVGTGEPFHARGARADTPRTPGGPLEERYWNVCFQAVRGVDGAIEGLMSWAFEVTDQILAARQADFERQRFDHLIGAIGVTVWSIRPADWVSTWAGGRVEQVLGVGAAVATSPQHFLADVHPDDRGRLMEARLRLREIGDRYEEEVRWTPPSGEQCWLAESGTLFEDAVSGGPVVWGLTRDVTQQVEHKQARQRLQEQLLHVQKLEGLGLLAGGIAHDFNNLLTAILGNASLAALEVGPHGPGTRSLEALMVAARRATDLTRQLLAYSGRGHFQIEPVDLNVQVRELLTLLEASISKKVVLRTDLEEGLPSVRADRSQIDQVLMNLVLNGAEALKGESGTVMVRTGQQLLHARDLEGGGAFVGARPGPAVFLEVSDTGEGMSSETLARIFDPFFSTKRSGRGLGLAAVQGIVRGHDGLIRVYSEVGRGTTFKLFLPVAEGAVVRPAAPSPTSTPVAAATVLLVDDEDAVREIARAALEFGGYRVVEARDGVEGVETFRALADEIGLVLLDLTMPRMSGEEACAEIRRLRPDVPVVLSSGYNEVEATRRLVGRQSTLFIQKPYTVEELLRVVAGAIAQARTG